MEREYVMPEIMTTKDLAKYLRFHKKAIDKWISEGEKKPHKVKKTKAKAASKAVKVILRKKKERAKLICAQGL